MKTRRIVSSLALAAGIALGATGCGLFAPQATLEPYAPSDGIDISIENIDVRNLLLIADESGENFNVVFNGVNKGSEPVVLSLAFVTGSTEARADFLLLPGRTAFGDPEGEIAPTLVSLPSIEVGSTVEAFVEVAGLGDETRQVPVLDGTLAEYRDYVLSPSQLAALAGEDEEGEEGELEEAAPVEGLDGTIEGDDEAQAE